VFIALGVMGNNQSAEINIPTYHNEISSQISIYQVNGSYVDARTFHWQQIIKYSTAKKQRDFLVCYKFQPEETFKYPIRQEHLSKYYLFKNIPNRAPPVV
jgi:hypothetical protein